MTKRHPHHPGLEETDYVADPNFVMEAYVPDPETGTLKPVEVAYGYRMGSKKTGYKTRWVFHDDVASRQYLAEAEIADARHFKRRHRASDWDPNHKPEKRYRVAPKIAAPGR